MGSKWFKKRFSFVSLAWNFPLISLDYRLTLTSGPDGNVLLLNGLGDTEEVTHSTEASGFAICSTVLKSKKEIPKKRDCAFCIFFHFFSWFISNQKSRRSARVRFSFRWLFFDGIRCDHGPLDWLIDWTIVRSIDWLIDWLIDWWHCWFFSSVSFIAFFFFSQGNFFYVTNKTNGVDAHRMDDGERDRTIATFAAAATCLATNADGTSDPSCLDSHFELSLLLTPQWCVSFL